MGVVSRSKYSCLPYDSPTCGLPHLMSDTEDLDFADLVEHSSCVEVLISQCMKFTPDEVMSNSASIKTSLLQSYPENQRMSTRSCSRDGRNAIEELVKDLQNDLLKMHKKNGYAFPIHYWDFR